MSWKIVVRLVPPSEDVGVVMRVGATSLALMQVGALPLELGEYEADADDLVLRLEVDGFGESAAGVRDLVGTAGAALKEAAPELADWQFLVDVQPRASAEEALVDEVEDYRAAVRSAARLFRRPPVAGLWDGAEGDALAGCLIQGAELMIDQLFDDLAALEAGTDDFDDLAQLPGLPSGYQDRYTPDFVRSFIVAATDLTAGLTGSWAEPACPAQDLAFRLLLDTAAVIAEAVSLELPFEWRERLLSKLTPENDEVDFEAWFTPYGPGRTLPPYVMPYPTD